MAHHPASVKLPLGRGPRRVGRRDPTTQTRDIWLIDLERGTQSRLTFDPTDDMNPTWSPDGSRFAFSSAGKGQRDIYVKAANLTSAPFLASTTIRSRSVLSTLIAPCPPSAYSVTMRLVLLKGVPSPHHFLPIGSNRGDRYSSAIATAVGAENLKYFANVKKAIDSGLNVSIGSDWPTGVADANPLRELQILVTRRNPYERNTDKPLGDTIRLEDAIRVMTMGGAYSMREDPQR